MEPKNLHSVSTVSVNVSDLMTPLRSTAKNTDGRDNLFPRKAQGAVDADRNKPHDAVWQVLQWSYAWCRAGVSPGWLVGKGSLAGRWPQEQERKKITM